jgi:hypothetical protein
MDYQWTTHHVHVVLFSPGPGHARRAAPSFSDGGRERHNTYTNGSREINIYTWHVLSMNNEIINEGLPN